MKIVIDARFYGPEHTGLGRYTTTFLHTLFKLNSPHKYFLLLRKKYWQSLTLPKNFTPILADIPHYSLQEQLILPPLIHRFQPDLYHALHFNIPLFLRLPFIATVHDLIKSHFSSYETSTRSRPIFALKRVGYQLVIGHALTKSSLIITPSNSIKQDILQHYPSLSPAKIHPVYEAPAPVFTHCQPHCQSLVTGQYLLYVGNAYPHKNLPVLLTALEKLPSTIKLVLVSKNTPFLQKTLSSFSHLSSRLVHLSHLSDQDLVQLYQQARLLVIPSLMEGFSLTGLEALSVGTPVVASNIPVHHEIYGSAVRYADPHDPISFAQAILKSLHDQYIGKLPRPYSWENFTKTILKLYEKAGSRLR